MTDRVRAGESLGPAVGAGALFTAWCAGGGDGPAAATDLARALAGDAPNGGPAPWFASEQAAGWADELAADLADDADRERLAADLAALRRGDAGVVVTGQQPGFLGGPLYTLHKIATAVALARRLTAAGRPTVPLFWSGDDDDDLVEACGAAAWAPGTGLVRSEMLAAAQAGTRPRQRVGTLPAAEGQGNGLAWLAAATGTVAAPGDPAAPGRLWTEAADAGWSWARLQRRALLRTFAGTGLLVVSGDDPRLHRAAAPVYARILPALGDLGAAVRARGAELEASGWHAQLGGRAAARPLFAVDGDRRRAVAAADAPADRGLLRPGVVLRSPVQDWLLQPRAVVVGPGEFAYLRQLTGVYAALGLPRAALVPRLFAWLLPAGFDTTLLARHRATLGSPPDVRRDALDRWQDATAASLRRLLAEDAGLPAARAEAMVAGRLRRWRRGLAAAVDGALREEARRRRPTEPAWVFPDGGRQERVLAWGAARALWGPGLVADLLAAADRHLDRGRDGDWREWEITVTGPEELG